jgi:hypothetical protein
VGSRNCDVWNDVWSANFQDTYRTSLLCKHFNFRAVYPWSLTGNAVSILEGVSIFNTKTEAFRSALEFLEFGVFPQLVTVYSHRVNIKKLCLWIEGRFAFRILFVLF